MSKKRIILAVSTVLIIAAGIWYYFGQSRSTSINKIVNNPQVFLGKEVAIEGEVTDRTAFFGTLKFYKIKDKTGEITVVTKRSLPETKSVMGVKGKIDDGFILGDQKLVVFVEESTDKRENIK